MKRGYMVDTNIFNALAKGQLQLSLFSFRPLFTTSIQRSELEATNDHQQRTLLMNAFAAIPSQKVHTSSAVWDGRVPKIRTGSLNSLPSKFG